LSPICSIFCHSNTANTSENSTNYDDDVLSTDRFPHFYLCGAAGAAHNTANFVPSWRYCTGTIIQQSMVREKDIQYSDSITLNKDIVTASSPQKSREQHTSMILIIQKVSMVAGGLYMLSIKYHSNEPPRIARGSHEL
jgi:general stress protein CsbA